MKQTSNGKDYCFLSVAVDGYNFTTKEKTTTWIRVYVGGRLAPLAEEFVRAGSFVVLSGKIGIKNGDKDKGTFDSVMLMADNMEFPKGAGGGSVGHTQRSAPREREEPRRERQPERTRETDRRRANDREETNGPNENVDLNW